MSVLTDTQFYNLAGKSATILQNNLKERQ